MGGAYPLPRLPEEGGAHGPGRCAGDRTWEEPDQAKPHWSGARGGYGRLLAETMREEAPGEMKRPPLYDFHRFFPDFLGMDIPRVLVGRFSATCVDFYYQILGDH